MFGLGIWELLIVLLIVIVLFSRRLPEIGEGLGKGIRSFKKAVRKSDTIDITPKESDEEGDKGGGTS
jgi:sec-independent protein translocase protein TatA